MSLLPLSIPVALAISFYEVSVKTVDVTYAKVNGNRKRGRRHHRGQEA